MVTSLEQIRQFELFLKFQEFQKFQNSAGGGADITSEWTNNGKCS